MKAKQSKTAPKELAASLKQAEKIAKSLDGFRDKLGEIVENVENLQYQVAYEGLMLSMYPSWMCGERYPDETIVLHVHSWKEPSAALAEFDLREVLKEAAEDEHEDDRGSRSSFLCILKKLIKEIES